jgi:hypothetical protein
MKVEEQTKLNETLVKVFKLTEEQLSTLYNGDGDLTDLKVVTDADEKRVAKFNAEKTQQLNRGIKEGAGKIEKELKEKYKVESDLIGVELVESIVVGQVEEATKAGTKDISKHPEYIKLQTSIDKQVKDRDKEWQSKLDAKEAEFRKSVIFDKVKSKALSFLDSSKAILPSDVRKAENWKATYLNELAGFSYLENEDGTFTVLDKEGNALKDSHSNIRTFDEIVKECADKYFDYPAAEQRSSSGNKPPAGNVGTGTGEPKTKAEALTKLKDPKITPEDRKKYTELMDNLKE